MENSAYKAGEWTQPPHNDLPASLNKRLGTALMNNGNYTFGTSPTALTPATCSTLDRAETFASKRNKTKFYTHAGSPPRVSCSSLTCSGETLELSFRMTGEFDHVNECIQEPPYRVNEDYDIAFIARISPEKADVSRSVSLSHPEQRDWPCCTGTKPNAAFFAQNDGKPSSAGTRSGSGPM